MATCRRQPSMQEVENGVHRVRGCVRISSAVQIGTPLAKVQITLSTFWLRKRKAELSVDGYLPLNLNCVPCAFCM
jgi:hypothetical protein